MSVVIRLDTKTDNYYATSTVGDVSSLFQLIVHGNVLKWEFIPPDSPRWHDLTQAIDQVGRTESVALNDKTIQHLPPIPEPPAPPSRGWPPFLSYRIPNPLPATESYPYLAQHLLKQPGCRADYFAVLYEDTYESTMGDGRFRYLKSLFRAEEGADAYMKKNKQDYVSHTMVPIRIVLENDCFTPIDLSFETFDHWSFADVLRVIEDFLSS